MDDQPAAKSLPPRGGRRRVGSRSGDWITIRPLFEDRPFPTLITPAVDGIDLAAWLEDNRPQVDELFRDRRALLFRGFEISNPDAFRRVVEAGSDGPRLPYRDRSTPREAFGHNIYNTTVYPPEYAIRLHNEGSYWQTWAMKAFFGCVTAPPVGGETPIGDVHAVHERIDPAIRAEFAAKDWMLVRNYNDGLGLPWQEVFQTGDRAEVEAYCQQNAIEFEWKAGDRLRTRQIRPAIRPHPRSGESLWFNHAAFFHITSREAPTRDAMLEQFAEEELPYHTYYGDGTPIPAEVVAHINAAYDAELVMFRWQEGDVHLIDNMRLAHARQPYEGDRLILVALTEACSG